MGVHSPGCDQDLRALDEPRLFKKGVGVHDPSRDEYLEVSNDRSVSAGISIWRL